METEPKYQKIIRETMLKAYVHNYEPHPIAVKLGYVCPECNGMRITPFYGEKVCLCEESIEGVKEWRKEREEISSTLAANLGYHYGSWICESCHKCNSLYGQIEETANTCNYCNHKQSPTT